MLRKGPTYYSWRAMKGRCLNLNDPAFRRYGGRGITVDPSWHLFDNFLRDMGERPDGMTLERTDNNQGYSKANCKWATRREQANNTRSNHAVEINGITKNVRQWCEDYNIGTRTVYGRIARGYSVVAAITTLKRDIGRWGDHKRRFV
jgi:hypothetical protein